ncbi:site-specific DNA-methyltransferase [Armatimonas sp.]|uniref:site-specific DNA-methyltransferase n=1 Tax=Armatimonas sp. TaxID=1872638 RepID=UPI003753D988
MPELTWTGKSAVKNHHESVPFRLLKPEPNLSLPQGASSLSEKGNLLVQGDNLLALKALLPYYAGQVKCIYIDPPYNTGNEGWVYNDNVNSAEMKEWIHKTVGKEAEDLNRHDKWLCMMYPRLQLLKQFLRDDGVIFISIDDNEISNLTIAANEIFGTSNLLGNFIWRRRPVPDARNLTGISTDHEYVLCYGKGKAKNFKFRGSEKDLSKYSNPDNDPRGLWMSDNLTGLANERERPNLHYDLIDPKTGKIYKPNLSRGWSAGKDRMQMLITENKILWPKSDSGRPRLKRFITDMQSDTTGFSTILTSATNVEGSKEQVSIFGEKVFAFPKPVGLIKDLLRQVSSDNDLVLDSFAGSGTAGHAVLGLNKDDGGNRRFILVEMDSHIASNITAERLRRVASGYGDMPGLGGEFTFCTLGETLLEPAGAINPKVSWGELARHIFFSETGTAISGALDESTGLLGVHNGTAYYLLWKGDGTGALTNKSLKTLAPHPDGEGQPRVVFAEACLIAPGRLATEGILFKQVPYEVKTR